jgi:hypothetical protein
LDAEVNTMAFSVLRNKGVCFFSDFDEMSLEQDLLALLLLLHVIIFIMEGLTDRRKVFVEQLI